MSPELAQLSVANSAEFMRPCGRLPAPERQMPLSEDKQLEESSMQRRPGMPNATFRIPVRVARRMPDPIIEGAVRHLFTVSAEHVPQGLPKAPNPRAQKTDKGIYKDVRRSLLNEEGSANTFHLKNKGMTLIADEVRDVGDSTFEVHFGPEQGIADGAHTYEIILEGQERIAESRTAEDGTPIDQYVKMEVLTGVPQELWVEIAGGLNTAVQVQEWSLANLKDRFDWIKDLLAGEPYARKIAFRENEADSAYDVRDIIVLLEMFNIFDYPNDGEEHPTKTYNNKGDVLDRYLADIAKYERLAPILKDVLRLHDHISLTAREKHNQAGGKAGKLTFVERKIRGTWEFAFIGQRGEWRLNRAALFPMLGAFRWMVKSNGATVEWRGGFDQVLKIWDESASELMRATQATSEEYGRKLTALGKSRNHWATLHSTVAKRELTARTKLR